MGLPTSREATHGTGSVIKGTTVDAIQDSIIGRKFGPGWRWLPPLGRAASELNLTWDTINGFVKATTAANFDLVVIQPNVGDRITTIGARVLGTGAGGNVVIRLFRNNGDGTGKSLMGTLTIATPPATWATYTAPLTKPENVADAMGYYFQADIPTANQCVSVVGYQSDRL